MILLAFSAFAAWGAQVQQTFCVTLQDIDYEDRLVGDTLTGVTALARGFWFSVRNTVTNKTKGK